jgi:hypothetical protein
MTMTEWNDLPPAEQRKQLASQMQISRSLDYLARAQTVEALAQSRELLAVPVYRLKDIAA